MLKTQKMKNDLMEKIMQYRFAVEEISLYLDTHPNDCDAVKRHNYFAAKAMELMDEYEKEYGGMLSIYSGSGCMWEWPDSLTGTFCPCKGSKTDRCREDV